MIRPGLTPDGTISEELQKKSLEHILARVGLKEPPPLETIFDFTLARKVNDELQSKGWKPWASPMPGESDEARIEIR